MHGLPFRLIKSRTMRVGTAADVDRLTAFGRFLRSTSAGWTFWYVDNRSLALDAKIVLLTIRDLVRREGITGTGHATMKRFDEPVR